MKTHRTRLLALALTLATTGCTTCGDRASSGAAVDEGGAALVPPSSSAANPGLRRMQQRKDLSNAIGDAGTGDPSP